jgi:acetyltransferase EpsM
LKNIVVIGAGDLGKEVVWLIEDINRKEPTYLILGFLDDDASKIGKEFYGYEVIGRVSDLRSLSGRIPVSAVIAIQDGEARKNIAEQNSDFGGWASIIHPTAVIAPSSRVGKGSILFPQVTVSVDSSLGDFGLYYIRSVICNDCRIGNYVSVMSGVSVSEHVEIGEESFLAAGCCVYPHKRLGRKTEVSVEAVVSKDYGDGAEVLERGYGLFRFK